MLHMENSVNNQETNDFIASLGTIYGVSEIRAKNSELFLGCPVLLAENAIVFFAWDELDAAGN